MAAARKKQHKEKSENLRVSEKPQNENNNENSSSKQLDAVV